MKRNENSYLDKEQVIEELIKMRINNFATTKTMLDFLMKELKYGQTQSYELINQSKDKISEIFKEEWQKSFDNAVARIEQIIESTKNEKMRLEAQKELNKLFGLHKPQVVDVTGLVSMPSEVVIRIVKDEQTDN